MPDASAMPRRLRLLHMLTGVFPVGLFLVGHVVTQAKVLAGHAAYERQQGAIAAFPLWSVLEGVVLASLAFHAAYGVRIASRTRTSGLDRATVAQRATGVIALVFLAFHLITLRVMRARYGVGLGALYPLLVAQLSTTITLGIPLAALGYLVGLAACTFHFAHGLSRFVVATGMAASEGARRAVLASCAVLGVALFVTAADATVALATGAKHFIK